MNHLKALLLSEMLELNGFKYDNKYYYLENTLNHKILTELELISSSPLTKYEKKTYYRLVDDDSKYLKELSNKTDKIASLPIDFNLQNYTLLMDYLKRSKKLNNEYKLTILREDNLIDNKDRILDLIDCDYIEDNKYFLSIHEIHLNCHTPIYYEHISLSNIFTFVKAFEILLKTANTFEIVHQIITLISTLKE